MADRNITRKSRARRKRRSHRVFRQHDPEIVLQTPNWSSNSSLDASLLPEGSKIYTREQDVDDILHKEFDEAIVQKDHVKAASLLDTAVRVGATLRYIELIEACARSGCKDIARCILHTCNNQVAAASNACIIACEQGQADFVQFLLSESKPDLSSCYRSRIVWSDGPDAALRRACKGGHESIVRMLLATGGDVCVNSCSWESIRSAAGSGHIGILSRLLYHAGPNAFELRAPGLIAAASSGQTSTIDWLIDRFGVEDTSDVITAVESASGSGHLDSLKALLSAFWRIETGHEHVLLHRACVNGHVEVVQFLLDRFQVRPSTSFLDCHFIAAAKNGCVGVMHVLLKVGVSRSTPRIALEASIAENQVDSVRFLAALPVQDIDVCMNRNSFLALALDSHQGAVSSEILWNICQRTNDARVDLPPAPSTRKWIIRNEMLPRAFRRLRRERERAVRAVLVLFGRSLYPSAGEDVCMRIILTAYSHRLEGYSYAEKTRDVKHILDRAYGPCRCFTNTFTTTHISLNHIE